MEERKYILYKRRNSVRMPGLCHRVATTPLRQVEQFLQDVKAAAAIGIVSTNGKVHFSVLQKPYAVSSWSGNSKNKAEASTQSSHLERTKRKMGPEQYRTNLTKSERREDSKPKSNKVVLSTKAT